MKYIDAERLKAEVKKIKNDYNRNSFVSGLAYLGKEEAIDEFCSIIDSLKQEQPEVDLEKASRNVYESWMGGTMDDVRRDMVELGKVLNARKGE